MVRSSGIREKTRSKFLKELARERGTKRSREERDAEEKQDEEDEEEAVDNEREKNAKMRSSKNSLLSMLPQPKNSSAFGATIKIEKLLQLPERADEIQQHSQDTELDPAQRIADDGILEVDIKKVVGRTNTDYIKELTIEKTKPVIIAKGKEKQKNQITYLAQLGKANELGLKEQAALGRSNKAAARSKYGW